MIYKCRKLSVSFYSYQTLGWSSELMRKCFPEYLWWYLAAWVRLYFKVKWLNTEYIFFFFTNRPGLELQLKTSRSLKNQAVYSSSKGCVALIFSKSIFIMYKQLNSICLVFLMTRVKTYLVPKQQGAVSVRSIHLNSCVTRKSNPP